ncbi:hypothetical protein C0J52_15144 [Blattella germanica]|nr:hypothetical protein C0J52_15144 [Blattella germanica]
MIRLTIRNGFIGPKYVSLIKNPSRHSITSKSSTCCTLFSLNTCTFVHEQQWNYYCTKSVPQSTLQSLKSSVPEYMRGFQSFTSRCCPSVFLISKHPYSTNANKQPDESNASVTEEKLTLFQKFKQMYRDYWYVLVPVHLVTSLGWFAGFYYLAKSGVDVIALLESMGLSEKLINPLRDSSAGYIALAYALYKVATPVRYTVTLGGTTISIKYLKEWGYIKPIPPREKLREMYQERKEQYQEELKLKQEKLKKTRDTMLRGYRDHADEKNEK